MISATAIGPITKLATSFVRCRGHCLACRRVSVPPDGRRMVNSDWNVVPHQRNQEHSKSGSQWWRDIIQGQKVFSVAEMFGMVSRYLVSMVVTCRPRTLSTRDINIEVAPELY